MRIYLDLNGDRIRTHFQDHDVEAYIVAELDRLLNYARDYTHCAEQAISTVTPLLGSA